MPYPETCQKLMEAGYRLNGTGKCRGIKCGATVEWWITPAGKKIPMDPMPTPESKATPHWATCPDSPQFRA